MRVAVRKLAAAAAITAGAALAAFSCVAQDYPAKPIRLVVPLAPGGGNDTTARLVGKKLTESLGQQVLVENRPGGAGAIAGEMVVRAPADGYTLYLASTTFSSSPALVRNLPFDTLRDFAPITRLAVVPGALIVHASLPAKSVKDVIALARERPGEVTFGSAGMGSGSHLGGELFKLLAHVNMVHVPYKGSALVTTALLSGEVMTAFTNPISSLPHVKAGRIRNLGVTSAERWPLFPDLPTLAESGVAGYELLIWNGIVVRTGTPPAITGRLHKEIVNAISAPDIVKHLAADGARPMVQSPEEFGAFLRNEVAKWEKVARSAGLRKN